MNTVLTIIVALLMFGVLIIAHEFGHFITAVKCGVKVEEFSMGMGPLLWQKETKTTKYSVRLLPIGGFCQMKGEDGDNYEPGSFNSIRPLKKFLVLAAGSIMNFLCAILIFFILFCTMGTDATTTIDTVSADSPAQAAGIVSGDTLLSINGSRIEKWEDITERIGASSGEALSVEVKKADGSVVTYQVTPYQDADQSYKIGITPTKSVNILKAFGNSFVMLWEYIKLIFGVFVGIFRGEFGLEAFSGPIGATVVIGQTLSMGLVYVLNIMASIAVSLGFFNMLPIPALDGSRIVFVLVEMIKGSPVNKEWESRIHMIGFALLMVFAVVIAYRDIITFF